MLVFFAFVGFFCSFIVLTAGIMLLAKFIYDSFINSHRHRIKVIATYRRDYPKMHLYSVDPTDGMFGPRSCIPTRMMGTSSVHIASSMLPNGTSGATAGATRKCPTTRTAPSTNASPRGHTCA